MGKCYIIIIGILWLCFPVITCGGTEADNCLNGVQGKLIQKSESVQYDIMYLSQNDEKKDKDQDATHIVTKAGKDKSQQETLTKDENSEKKNKHENIFVPSETIPADQGVDFPYDI